MTPTAPTTSSGARTLTAAAVVAIVVTAVTASLSGAVEGTALSDPGVLVRWGLPLTDLVVTVAATLTVGALTLAAFVLPRAGSAGRGGRGPRVRPDGAAWPIAQRTAAAASVVWTLGVAVQLVLTYAQVAGRSPTAPGFTAELELFLTRIELGQAGLWALALTAVTALAAVATASSVGAAWSALAAALAFIPVAASGHAAGAADHILAVGALYLHLIPVTMWIGGLVVLVLVAPRLGRDVSGAVSRYSVIAAWSLVLVVISGVASASVRLAGPADLFTAYGALLIGKALGTLALGLLGLWHRRRTIPRLNDGAGGLFWRLVAVEVLVAAAVIGLATTLSSTPPPVPEVPLEAPTPGELITGYPVPVAPTAFGWAFFVRPDVLVLAGIGSAAVMLVRWCVRLRRRGDAWPWARVAWGLLGLAVLAWVTSGGAAVYGMILFSAHMVQHMLLVMLIPIFLVLAAPVTLALRALPGRDDASLGPRELLLAVVHSKVAGFFGNPVIAAVNVVLSMFVFYFTPLFQYSLSNHLVHLWMIVHFTLTGYLFVNALIGIDPGPTRPGYPIRLLLLFATMGFHAFFGLFIAQSTSLIAAPWFGGLGLPWGVDALADQQLGGYYAWAFGEVPSLVLAVALGIAWIRDDERTAKRLDRAAARDGEADLAAYNAMLARMAGGETARDTDQGTSTPPPGTPRSDQNSQETR